MIRTQADMSAFSIAALDRAAKRAYALARPNAWEGGPEL